jgi:hypothetical protein
VGFLKERFYIDKHLYLLLMLRLTSTLALIMLGNLVRAQTPTFSPAVSYATGSSFIYGLTVADLNGDGKIDAVTANGGNQVGVLLGTGSGTFQPVVTYASGPNSGTADVQIVDANGDGKLDLLTANLSTSTVGVLLGNGDGTFQAATTYPTGAGGALSLAVADLNGDGKIDVVLNHSLSTSASVLLGNGNGTFQPEVLYNIPTRGGWGDGSDIAIGDVNSDGKLDLITSHINTSFIGVLLGRGDGTFQPATVVTAGAATRPKGVALADMNNDGQLDVLTANYGNATVGVLVGTGTGTFQAATTYSIGASSYPNSLAVVDMTSDGKPDLLVTTATSVGSFALLAVKGDGTFQTPVVYSTANTTGESSGLAVADLNGDGKLDVLTTNSLVNTLSVMLNTTTTPLSTHVALPGATTSFWPNPTEGHVSTLALAGLPSTVAQVQATLLDAIGRPVAQHTLRAAQGVARAEVPTAGLATGLYMLRLSAFDVRGATVGTLPLQRLNVR